MSQATAQDTINHHDDVSALRYWGDGGIDEIYVGAGFLDRSGNTISKVESNRLTGDF